MKLRPYTTSSGITFQDAKAYLPNFERTEELPEKTSSIDLDLVGPLNELNTEAIFNYEIFPSNIMRFEAEWQKDGRRMSVGDIILQRAIFPPIGMGLCIEFAVRISKIIREERKLGFTYETLKGHVERGTSEFYLEEKRGNIYFTIHTFSEPASWFGRLVKGFFTVPYQTWCTQQALKNVKTRLRIDNAGRG